MPQKDESITEVGEQLRSRFGTAIEVADHWPDDPSAVRLETPALPGHRVYVATFGRSRGRYDVQCELPPLPGSESPYEPAGDVHDIDFAQLVSAVARHFGLSPSRPAG